MDVLTNEWRALHENDYKLKFTYPTMAEKKELRIINKVAGGKAKTRRTTVKQQREQLLQAVQRGEVDADQLILELEALKKTGKQK
ncbi:hypothetical protein ASE35_14105 [Lysobacter sp. Root916]|nr:hypothetical protein ASE35_14105 [Lysobacter sp. Root916]